MNKKFAKVCHFVSNEKLGRHLVAKSDIFAGDVIFEEVPLLISPHWIGEQMKCSQCFRDSYIICKRCNVFPLCLKCNSHYEFDCNFFQHNAKHIDKNLLVKNYSIYALLKLLLLLENPKTYDRVKPILNRANSLIESEGNGGVESKHLRDIVIDPILKSGIGELFTKISVNAVVLYELCAHIDANSFEVIGSGLGGSNTLRGVYVDAAQFSHHCIPNTVIAINDDYRMIIYAAVFIEKNSIIYNSYTSPLMGTSQRQQYLRINKQIDCSCSRCLDPTELGTHMSSLKCQQCPNGYAVCDLNKSKNWICLECTASIQSATVAKLVAEVIEETMRAGDDLCAYENLLVKYSKNFHQNHYLLIAIKQNLSNVLRGILSHSSKHNPCRKFLERRLTLCEELLPVVRAIQPGLSKLYAIALYEYLLTFLQLTKDEFKRKDIEVDQYLNKQKFALKLAGDAVEMLSFEPPNSPEEQLIHCIALELKHIQRNIKKYNI